MASEEE